MNTHNLRPTWWRSKDNYRPMPRKHESSLNELLSKLRTVGLLLLLGISVILVLSACQPVVIRQACDPYPLPSPDLLKPPLNQDLVPQRMKPSPSPPTSVKTG